MNCMCIYVFQKFLIFFGEKVDEVVDINLNIV